MTNPRDSKIQRLAIGAYDAWREAHSLKNNAACAQLGIDPTALSAWRNERRAMSLAQISMLLALDNLELVTEVRRR